MLQYQPYIQQLPDLTFTLGTTQQKQSIDLKQLEKRIFKESEIANLLGFVVEIDLDPTFTAVPAVIGHNNALANIRFYDGSDALFDGQGNDLRMFETLEQGWSIQGEAVTQTSTNNRYWTRFLPVGPLALAGSPSDYGVACAELSQGGTLDFTPSVLTDVSADTTAAVMVVRTAAVLAPSKNELRVGPKYQRLVQTNKGSGTTLGDEALYAYIAAVDASYAGFAAGDWSKISVGTTKRGKYVDSVDAELLGRVFNSQMAPGLLGQVMGEPRDATYDVAPRIVNFASATAIAAQSPALQPIIWCPRGTRLSKLFARVDQDDTLKIEYSGAQAANTGAFLCGRFLPHSGDAVKRRVAKAAQALGVNAGAPAAKTLNKRAPKPSMQQAKYGVYYAKVA